MSRCRWTLVVAASFPLLAMADTQVAGSVDPLFQDLDVVDVRLTAPFAAIMSSRHENEQFDGRLSYVDEAGNSTELELEIRTRGRYRLKENICPFAPLRLNFKKSQTEGSLFAGQDKLKLVTHCKDNSERYRQALLREYLAYRILNQLTDISFRVRLLKITYADMDEHWPQQTTHGFVIEHEDRLARRAGLEPLEVERIGESALQPGHLNLVSVFHFLIGNTDFSPVAGSKENCCHNHALLGRDGGLAYSVPYDFDQAGMVNAPHATANPRFKLSSVRQRLYRGRCRNNEILDETLEKYRQQRGAILQLSNEEIGLTNFTRKKLQKYIEQFYAIIDAPKKVNRLLVKKCI